jgi:hypothetical protein
LIISLMALAILAFEACAQVSTVMASGSIKG